MRRGSLEYWPHRRAHRVLPRTRSWPSIAEPCFLGIVGFKAGMTHVSLISDSESSSQGTEVIRPVTIVEVPKSYVYGIRLYKKEEYKEPAADFLVVEQAKRLGISNVKNTIDKLEKLKADLSMYVDATALMFVDTSELGTGNKRIYRYEMHVGGKSVEEKVAFIEKWMGKEVRIQDILKEGEYVDVTAVTKGKGWAGVIKRFGVARQAHKATGKIRHVGTLGPWHPPKVMFGVPHSGHMGFNYRTELNKRVLKLGSATDTQLINQKGGIINYGIVKNDFAIIDGSLPGPAKRLLRIRRALRKRGEVKQPQLQYISIESKQHA